MPHDFNAQEVQPGDRVFVPAIVQEVHATENNEYCNLTLVTEHPMPGTDNKKLTLTLNSKQTLLQAKDVGMENLKEAQEQQAAEEAKAKKDRDPHLAKARKVNNQAASDNK